MKKWINAVKRNFDLEKKLSALDKENIDKDKRIIELRVDVDKEFSKRVKIETEYNELKKKAIDFYKNELLISSIKIIMELLKEEKPSNKLLEQQMLAQQQLRGLQNRPDFRSVFGNIFG